MMYARILKRKHVLLTEYMYASGHTMCVSSRVATLSSNFYSDHNGVPVVHEMHFYFVSIVQMSFTLTLLLNYRET